MAEEKQADFFEYAFYRDAMTGEVLPDLPERLDERNRAL